MTDHAHRTGSRVPALAVLGLGVALALSAAGCGGEAPGRSVVIITLDTVRADHLGCYGCPLPTSPGVDALAQRGILFENAYAPMPQTLPSHATLFTGLSPRRHGALENGPKHFRSHQGQNMVRMPRRCLARVDHSYHSFG